MSQRLAMFLGLLASLAFATAPARATVLSVGATNVPPDVFTLNPVNQPGNQVVATQTLTYSNLPGTPVTGIPTGTLDVTVTEYVVRVTTANAIASGSLVQTSGDLDFVYQVTNHSDSLSGIGRFTVSNFGTGPFGSLGPVILDTGYVAGTGTTGTATYPSEAYPDTVDRLYSSNGNTIGWNYNTFGVAKGNTSAVMVVATNATTFTGGAVAVSDGSTINLTGFQPGPEPSSVVLAGLGALGLVGYGLRRRKAPNA